MSERRRLGHAAPAQPPAGAREDLDRALLAYNHSTSDVRAIRRCARRMRLDERSFPSHCAWQLYIRPPDGIHRVTGPGRRNTNIPLDARAER